MVSTTLKLKLTLFSSGFPPLNNSYKISIPQDFIQ
uniref:Uncharacterized protein n=1 Tax=Enterococcus faecalis TaxID=1351 RepID=Q9F1E9_ENTFL|nr:hypothetical protein [Enterococcus faecalis]